MQEYRERPATVRAEQFVIDNGESLAQATGGTLTDKPSVVLPNGEEVNVGDYAVERHDEWSRATSAAFEADWEVVPVEPDLAEIHLEDELIDPGDTRGE